ncbi:hypothetical protein ACLB2K_003963 [Fragaria x ananassa]
MVGSQPIQDTNSALSMEQVFQMFAQLTGQIQSLTTHVTDLARKEKKSEDRIEQSIFEEEISSHTDGEPRLCMMANHDFQVASFLMRDVYMDTGQMQDQPKRCPITGRDREAALSHDKREEAAIMDWRRFDELHKITRCTSGC